MQAGSNEGATATQRLDGFDLALVALSMVFWYLAFGVVGLAVVMLLGFGSSSSGYANTALAIYWVSPLVGAVLTWLVIKKRKLFSVLSVAVVSTVLLGAAELLRPPMPSYAAARQPHRLRNYHRISWGLRLGAVVTGSILGAVLGERIRRNRRDASVEEAAERADATDKAR